MGGDPMKYRSLPSRVSGTIRAPPSKSVTHRAMVLAALSSGSSQILRPLRSEDTDATLDGVVAFGAHVVRDRGSVRVDGDSLRVPNGPVDARNSGTTLRLLAGGAALLPGATTLTGGQRYRATDTDVPGDFSSAAFPLVASAITDGDVTVTGLDVDGPLGDRKIVDILRAFGASIEVSVDRVRAQGGPLVAQTVDIGE